jgi:hypothetical protein
MLCTGCGTQSAVVGRFCTRCDDRARRGTFERRRPLGGSQWQALWGINYGARADDAQSRRWLQGGIALAVAAIAVLLVF